MYRNNKQKLQAPPVANRSRPKLKKKNGNIITKTVKQNIYNSDKDLMFLELFEYFYVV